LGKRQKRRLPKGIERERKSYGKKRKTVRIVRRGKLVQGGSAALARMAMGRVLQEKRGNGKKKKRLNSLEWWEPLRLSYRRKVGGGRARPAGRKEVDCRVRWGRKEKRKERLHKKGGELRKEGTARGSNVGKR